MNIIAASSGIDEALKAAESSGIDKPHLVYLLELVAEGKLTDFFQEELVDKGNNEVEVIQINVPQYEIAPKHCRLSKVS
jgi:hypothetical protein